MELYRSELNPIIRPEDVRPSNPAMEVIGVFNAGAARLGNEVILMLRVAERPVSRDPAVYLTPLYDAGRNEITMQEIPRKPEYDFSDPRVVKTTERNYLTSISHFRVARSGGGVHFRIDDKPTIMPETKYESYGIEDPRITQIGGTYYITYSAISEYGICASMISTTDFAGFKRHGNLFHPDNKDVVLFPRLIAGKYYALHRPSCSHYGQPEIWIAESSDLLQWGNHRQLIGVREGQWDGGRIGASLVPLETGEGWLEIYHGADRDNKYSIGALLLDKNEPWRVIARSELPLMSPEAEYEMEGFFGNVIFPCGALQEDGLIKMYYGASDTSIGYAELSVSSITAKLIQTQTKE
ncbi:glycoside hydrolase family 130 protein [Paenibacillus sp. S150]|uniref:glycoside hydrolase family 130 protein n=1 Tax=Paenibacillus sp. S150 TaxID=2749826 RepID=UPI001C564935|nr:glycoside hydrolase family 130 protein [Paenibacillus sp. S150]MBW4079931.1 glycosidase [Paenibacillus sp. S150]